MTKPKLKPKRTKGQLHGPTFKVDPAITGPERRAIMQMRRHGQIGPGCPSFSQRQMQQIRPKIDAYADKERNYTARLVTLEVKIDNQTVCFNCLQGFDQQPPTLHHLLPWRYHNLADYPSLVPVVKVHRHCTARWHDKWDPDGWSVGSSTFSHYLTVAQAQKYGFALYYHGSPWRNSRLLVSAGLMAFISGYAHQHTPTDKWLRTAARLVSPTTHFYDPATQAISRAQP